MKKREQYLAELQQIAAANNGLLRPEDVVDFAKDPRTALHGCFTWDDAAAAHQHRLQQARALIRVTVTVLPHDGETKFRAFVSLKPDRYTLPGGGYRVFVDTMTDGDLQKQLLLDAMEEMQTFMTKYETLKELADVFDAMNRIVNPRRTKTKTRTRKYQPTAQAAGEALLVLVRIVTARSGTARQVRLFPDGLCRASQ
jgi:hypothetical protein